jgi:hypothetical protein
MKYLAMSNSTAAFEWEATCGQALCHSKRALKNGAFWVRSYMRTSPLLPKSRLKWLTLKGQPPIYHSQHKARG